MKIWKLAPPWIASGFTFCWLCLCAGAAGAQLDSDDACRNECRVEATECVSSCAEADEPIECESDCRDQREACESDCD